MSSPKTLNWAFVLCGMFVLTVSDRSVAAGAPVYSGAGTGRHYWIDIARGNDGNPGTQTLPWKTMDKVQSVALAPGDLVHVMPGLYDLAYNLYLHGKRGRADAWIGIQAEGAVKLRNSDYDNVIVIVDCHYLFLKGFEITHDNRGGAYGGWDQVDGVKFKDVPSDHVSIDSCRIHDLGNGGISAQAPEVQHVTVYNSEIYNCFVGIYWGYYEATVKRYAHFGRIANNYIHDCPPVDLDGNGYGIQIKGGSRGNVIEDNVLVNVAGNLLAAIAVYHISTDLATYAEHNVIRRNFIRGARNEGIFAVEGATLENNIIVDSRTYAISVKSRNTGGWGTFYGNLKIRNNTVFRVGDAYGRALLIQDGAFVAPFVVANNLLIVMGGSGQLALWGPSAFSGTTAKNFCYGGASGSNLGVTPFSNLGAVQSTTYGAPGFLYPSSGSLLVDAGSATLASLDDFNGRGRGAAPEVGAYEFLSNTNPGWTLSDGFRSTAIVPLLTLSVNDIRIVEGNSGTFNALFTLSLSASSTQVVSVSYATADGTATAGSDYVTASGSVSFPTGTVSRTVTVPVVGDIAVEPDEAFFVRLTSPVNATLADAEGVATIANDDTSSNPLPVADAGPDQEVGAGDGCLAAVTLDGTGSFDPDGGALTYLWEGPFGTASGPTPAVSLPLGTHLIQLTVKDLAGATATDTTVVAVNTCSLGVRKDSFLRRQAGNRNEGANLLLRVGDIDVNRGVVGFDLAGVSTNGLARATLVLNVAGAVRDSSASGYLVELRRFTMPWSEGNGRLLGFEPPLPGSGLGGTWNCRIDREIGNTVADCSPYWRGGSKVRQLTASGALHLQGMTGEVTWNVTGDIVDALTAGALEVGWLIKKRSESELGVVDYYSKEGAAAVRDLGLAPRLVLEYQ